MEWALSLIKYWLATYARFVQSLIVLLYLSGRIHSACCGEVAECQWRHTFLTVKYCIFMLKSRHLRLGWLQVWVTISIFASVRSVFVPWFLLPPWVLGERDGCRLHGGNFFWGLVSLACLAGVIPRYMCWCWRQTLWDELEKARPQESFLICWNGSKRKRQVFCCESKNETPGLDSGYREQWSP